MITVDCTPCSLYNFALQSSVFSGTGENEVNVVGNDSLINSSVLWFEAIKYEILSKQAVGNVFRTFRQLRDVRYETFSLHVLVSYFSTTYLDIDSP